MCHLEGLPPEAATSLGQLTGRKRAGTALHLLGAGAGSSSDSHGSWGPCPLHSAYPNSR